MGREVAGRIRFAPGHVARGNDYFEAIAERGAAEHEIDLVPRRSRHDAEAVALAGVADELIGARHHREGTSDQLLIDARLAVHQPVEQLRR